MFLSHLSKLDPSAKRGTRDRLILSCLEDFLADNDPVTCDTQVIGDGPVTFRFIQSWTGREGDLFVEFIKHPTDSSSYERIVFLYFWIPKKEETPAVGQLVAVSDIHLHGE